MSYRIDLTAPTVLVPCTFVNSIVSGKTISVNEDGTAVVVLPDGSQRVPSEPPGPDWDSAWTQATVMSGYLVYRSSGQLVPGGPVVPGTPRGYRMLA